VVEEAILHHSGKPVKAVKHTQPSTFIYIYSFDLLMIIGLVATWSAWPVPPLLILYYILHVLCTVYTYSHAAKYVATVFAIAMYVFIVCYCIP